MNGDETAKRSDENEIYTGFRNPDDKSLEVSCIVYY